MRVPARNIIRTGLLGIRGRTRTLGNYPSKSDIWKLLFDNEIINKIVKNTNVKLQTMRSNLGEDTNKSNFKTTCSGEINALLGLMLSSLLKSNYEKILSLFSQNS